MPHAPTARRKPQPTHAARECQRCRPSALRHPPPCTAAPHQPRPPLLKLRPVGTGYARASDPHRLRATSAPSASIAAHRSFAEPHSLSPPLCLWTSCRGLRERVTRGGVVPAALASRHPVKTLGDEVLSVGDACSSPKLLTGTLLDPCSLVTVRSSWVVRFANQSRWS